MEQSIIANGRAIRKNIKTFLNHLGNSANTTQEDTAMMSNLLSFQFSLLKLSLEQYIAYSERYEVSRLRRKLKQEVEKLLQETNQTKTNLSDDEVKDRLAVLEKSLQDILFVINQDEAQNVDFLFFPTTKLPTATDKK